MKCDKCEKEIVMSDTRAINFYFTGRSKELGSDLTYNKRLVREIVCPECFHKWEELIQYMRENEVKIVD